jgi:hypothetical protein
MPLPDQFKRLAYWVVRWSGEFDDVRPWGPRSERLWQDRR